MLQDVFFLVAGFGLLVLGGNWLLKSSVDMAIRLGVPRMVVGLTVVSFATSAPELIVSLNAALNGSSGIALGNVMGSNIANIGLVLGATLLITSMEIPQKFFRSDWLFLMGSTLILLVFLLLNHTIDRWEGVVFVLCLALFIYTLLQGKHEVDPELEKEVPVSWGMIALYLVIGGVALWGGSEMLVGGAKNIAKSLDIPESVIGLTVVAIGTSVPELAASIIAAVKGEKSISLGNLIGSNIFNIFSVLGITAIIQPIRVEDLRFVTSDCWWVLGFALAILPLSFVTKKYHLGKLQGILLLTTYVIYVYLAF